MRKKVEIEIDVDLVQEAIRRYHLADAREAVHLALRTLLGDPRTDAGDQEDNYDEFSDLKRVATAPQQRHRVVPATRRAVVWCRCAPGCTLF